MLRQWYLTRVALIAFNLADFERVKARKVQHSRGFDMIRAVENLIDLIAGALAVPPLSRQMSTRMLERAERTRQAQLTVELPRSPPRTLRLSGLHRPRRSTTGVITMRSSMKLFPNRYSAFLFGKMSADCS